jgi:hypothetical protein
MESYGIMQPQYFSESLLVIVTSPYSIPVIDYFFGIKYIKFPQYSEKSIIKKALSIILNKGYTPDTFNGKITVIYSKFIKPGETMVFDIGKMNLYLGKFHMEEKSLHNLFGNILVGYDWGGHFE